MARHWNFSSQTRTRFGSSSRGGSATVILWSGMNKSSSIQISLLCQIAATFTWLISLKQNVNHLFEIRTSSACCSKIPKHEFQWRQGAMDFCCSFGIASSKSGSHPSEFTTRYPQTCYLIPITFPLASQKLPTIYGSGMGIFRREDTIPREYLEIPLNLVPLNLVYAVSSTRVFRDPGYVGNAD